MIEVAFYNSQDHQQTRLSGTALRVGSRQDCDVAIQASSQDHACCTLEEIEHGGRAKLLVTNHGQSLVLPGGKRILAGMTRELDLPAQFWLGQTIVYARAADAREPIDDALIALPRFGDASQDFAAAMKKLGSAPASHTLAYWFDSLSRLQRSVAGSPEFFANASYSLFDPGGLDVGMLLLRNGSDWRIAASYVSHADAAIVYRRSVVDACVNEKRTLFHDAKHVADHGLDGGTGFVVASPIVDDDGEVIAVLYGCRFDHANNSRRGVRPLEAQFVQAVADAISAGLARLHAETKAAQSKARLELAFSPKVVRELERNPKLLEGDQRIVTALFCDLRGFTSLCERLSPRESFTLLGDVMDQLTACVARHDGIVLDYFGDGLAAFWNAPLPQADHAALACRAALDMQQGLPEVSADWFAITGRHLRLGIGVHTGPALVGNAGSRQRVKYGPRGTTLNVASRVQDATKRISLPILITKATADCLQGASPCRQVAKMQLTGIEENVDLYQLVTANELARFAGHQAKLEGAIESLSAGHLQQAGEIITSLQQDGVLDPAVDHLARLLRECSADPEYSEFR